METVSGEDSMKPKKGTESPEVLVQDSTDRITKVDNACTTAQIATGILLLFAHLL